MYGYRSSYRRRLGNGPVAPFGRPLYPVPFNRKRPRPQPAAGAVGAEPRMGRRVRRRIGSKLVTRTVRKRKLFGGSKKNGENSSISATHIGRSQNISRMILNKLMGHQTLQYNFGNSQSSTQGRQSTVSIPLLSRTDLIEIEKVCNGGTAAAMDLNLFLKTSKFRLHIRNQSNSPSKLLIYDISTFNTGYTATIDTPTEAWDFGYNDMGTPTQSERIGATPFGSAEFRKNFRINKVTYVSMEPGQQHEHTVTKHMNWFTNSTKWANTAAQNVRGLTHFVMLVWHGALAHESTVPTNVTYTPVRMDYTVFKKYNFAYVQQNKTTYQITDTLATTIADLDMMGENQDQDLDPVVA